MNSPPKAKAQNLNSQSSCISLTKTVFGNSDRETTNEGFDERDLSNKVSHSLMIREQKAKSKWIKNELTFDHKPQKK